MPKDFNCSKGQMAFCTALPSHRALNSCNVVSVPPPGSTMVGGVSDCCDKQMTISKFCHAKNYYNPAKCMVYTRYSDCDWDATNCAHFTMADRERTASERLRMDTHEVVSAADMRTRNRQCCNTKILGNRVYDISYWKEELLTEVRAMEIESENLKEHKRLMEKALEETRVALEIAEECMLHREKRIGIDQVKDEPERCLVQEILTIRKVQCILTDLIEKANIQLKLNRAALHACDFDIRDKHHAQGIDDRAHHLRNSSFGIGYHPGVEYTDNTVTDTAAWIKYTRENIVRSMHERQCSEALRGQVDCALRQCANELWAMYNAVNHALAKRIVETTEIKKMLQAHLQRVVNEIRDQERNINSLRASIHNKEAAMKVVQTRLNERTRRINVELCNDEAMHGLQCEVDELRETVRVLRERLHAAELVMCRLYKTRNTLEVDIAVKEHSLQVDQTCVMGRRKSMPMQPNVGPIYNAPSCH